MNCSACGHIYLNEEIAGKDKVKCPKCGLIIKKKGKRDFAETVSWGISGAGISFAFYLYLFPELFSLSGDGLDKLLNLIIFIVAAPILMLVGFVIGAFAHAQWHSQKQKSRSAGKNN